MSLMIITRNENQSVMIGDDVEITVLKVRGPGRVRLSINAPRTIPVHRREVYDAIKKGDNEKGQPKTD